MATKQILCISVIALAVMFASVFAQSPFQSGRPMPANPESGWTETVMTSILRAQLSMRQEISSAVKSLQNDKKISAVLLLAVFSFLYGLFHALGPGHGKNIVMSSMLADSKPSVFKGMLIGTIVAFGEVISAIVIVFGIYHLSLGAIGTTFETSSSNITTASYSLIALLGLVLLCYRIFKHLPVLRGKEHKHAHTANAATRQSLPIAVLLGFIPCPGVMILLVFMIGMKLPWLGILLALITALGMALTISFFGVAVAVFKKRLLMAVSSSHRRLELFEAGLEITGAILIISIATMFLLL